MARNPAGNPENYVHIVVGIAPGGIAVETKTTVNGATTYEAPSRPTSDAEVRLSRESTAQHRRTFRNVDDHPDRRTYRGTIASS